MIDSCNSITNWSYISLDPTDAIWQHRTWLTLVVWWHQAITWTNILAYHQWNPVVFIWGQFYWKCSQYKSSESLKWVIIGWNNGFSPVWCWAIIHSTSITPQGTDINEKILKLTNFHWQNFPWILSSVIFLQFCSQGDYLTNSSSSWYFINI